MFDLISRKSYYVNLEIDNLEFQEYKSTRQINANLNRKLHFSEKCVKLTVFFETVIILRLINFAVKVLP